MILPFLRWPGGKRWLARRISGILKNKIEGRYFEPFLGAGAMFFSLAPQKAVLSDINEDLIQSFQNVADQPLKLLSKIKSLPVNEEKYYEVRSWKPHNSLDQSARFIYLNRTCYGGIYRTNKKGEFNVPYGGGSRTPEILWESDLIVNASEILNGCDVKLTSYDFEKTISEATDGDLVYCDPVYTSFNNQFDRYTSKSFTWEEQKRLHKVVIEAYNRGATVIMSNTYCKRVKNLYKEAQKLKLFRNKSIGNSTKNSQKNFEYLLILDQGKEIKESMIDQLNSTLSKVLY